MRSGGDGELGWAWMLRVWAAGSPLQQCQSRSGAESFQLITGADSMESGWEMPSCSPPAPEQRHQDPVVILECTIPRSLLLLLLSAFQH